VNDVTLCGEVYKEGESLPYCSDCLALEVKDNFCPVNSEGCEVERCKPR
jgi:hypothetical protein